MAVRSLKSAEVRTFVSLVAAYCELIEARETLTAPELLARLRPLLADLYAAGARLPEPDPGARRDHEGRVPKLDWREHAESLAAKLGARDLYLEMFAAYDFTTWEPVTGSLSDDLSDIYLDLSHGLALWRAGEEHTALWEWHFGFVFHWGEHLTSALRAIHTLAVDFEYAEPPRPPTAET